MRILFGLAGLLGLSACAAFDPVAEGNAIAQINLMTDTQRAIDLAYRDKPFDTGTVSVIANEHGDIHTYSLTPCHGGTRICGGTGRVGQVQRSADYFIVTGAYRDRTFYLSPGGDGYLNYRGVNRDLAWN